MSPRRFEGWAPATIETVVDRDPEGRPVKIIHRPEPEWDAEDRALIQAMLEAEADLCDGCGQPKSITLGNRDPAKDAADIDRWFTKNPDNYLVRYLVCSGCYALERVQQKVAVKDDKARENNQPVYDRSRVWQVIPRPTPSNE